jgi:hypothetical protein
MLSGTRPAELYYLLVAAMWLFYPAQKRILLRRAAQSQQALRADV